MRNAITLNNSRMPLVEYQGLRVVTFAMVDKAHQRKDGTAQRTFTRHKNYFREGKDYFVATAAQNRLLVRFGITIPNRGLTLLTETGYLLLVKPFSDPLSWQVQTELVEAYFRHIPQFPELRKFHVPDMSELAALSLHEAQHLIARVDRESFTQHGQKGSAAMRLRREELKQLRPAHRLIVELSQPQLPEVEGEADE